MEHRKRHDQIEVWQRRDKGRDTTRQRCGRDGTGKRHDQEEVWQRRDKGRDTIRQRCGRDGTDRRGDKTRQRCGRDGTEEETRSGRGGAETGQGKRHDQTQVWLET